MMAHRPEETRTAVTIVHGDLFIRRAVSATLEDAGYDVDDLSRGAELLARRALPGIVLLDLALEDIPGLRVLEHVLASDRRLPVIVCARGDDVAGHAAMEAGAYDVVASTEDTPHLLRSLARAGERRRLTDRVRRLETELTNRRAQAIESARSLPRVPLVPMRKLEQMAIRRALEATDGNVSEAARLLGIGRATVYRRLAEMDVRSVHP